MWCEFRKGHDAENPNQTRDEYKYSGHLVLSFVYLPDIFNVINSSRDLTIISTSNTGHGLGASGLGPLLPQTGIVCHHP